MKKLVIIKSEIVVGCTSIYDNYLGQFYPNEEIATILEYEVLNEDSIEDALSKYDYTDYIVCDYYNTVRGIDIYKHNNNLYFVKGNYIYTIVNKKILKLSVR